MLKNFIAFTAISLALGSMASADCKVLEAQVIAKVKSVSMMDETACSLDLDYTAQGSMFNSHVECPLDIDSALGRSVTLKKSNYQFSCPYEPGDQFSGYLYQDATGKDDTIYTDY